MQEWFDQNWWVWQHHHHHHHYKHTWKRLHPSFPSTNLLFSLFHSLFPCFTCQNLMQRDTNLPEKRLLWLRKGCSSRVLLRVFFIRRGKAARPAREVISCRSHWRASLPGSQTLFFVILMESARQSISLAKEKDGNNKRKTGGKDGRQSERNKNGSESLWTTKDSRKTIHLKSIFF